MLKILWSGMKEIRMPKVQVLPQNTIREALCSCPSLERLDVSGYWKVHTRTLIETSKSCVSLTYVNLAGCLLVDDEVLDSFSRFCPGITSLNLKRCNKITDRGIKELARLRFLNQLNIRGCSQISDSGFKCISKNGQLTHLNMGWTKLSDVSVKGLSDCKYLRSLNLDWNLNLSEATILNLISNLPDLQAISMRHLDISSNGIQDISRKCPRLESIDISHCQHFDNLSAVSIRQHCPRLSHLKMSEHPCIDLRNIDTLTCSKYLTDVTITEMILSLAPLDRLLPEFSQQLVHLNLGTTALTSQLVSQIFAHKYPNLRDLNLALPDQLDGMRDQIVSQIVSSCKLLTHLDFSNWRGISDNSLAVIANSYSHVILKLNVSGCQRVTDEGMSHVMSLCSGLEELGVGRIPNLTPEILAKIPRNFRNLQKLDLRETQADIRVVENLSTWNFNLKNLNLMLCPNFTEDVLSEISVVGKFPNLRKLYVSGIEISAKSLSVFSQKRPLTRVFSDTIQNYLFIFPQNSQIFHTTQKSLFWAQLAKLFPLVPETIFHQMHRLAREFCQMGSDADPEVWAETWAKIRECAIRFKYHVGDSAKVFLMGNPIH
eukprot:TRINITY_DN2177_c0_g1_i6.p1 TRINITY_DN2177_c0_g1~~TRINITY_DN2177_c0_g1_i6.p1  ORF type:complete len:601 (-),score=155.66 TRINITY_DN2177_c0_g1_i6:39-1841(-)